MTTVLPQSTKSDVDELRAQVEHLTAGLAAVIDELVSRHKTARWNYAFYDPTDEELAAIDADVRAYWNRVANAATTQTGGVA
ncbi:hypothetical protein [Umezawaea tangerina]|uniref:Uncharacterized protein n=1 Tax=Umezawaea tangerina TaxID=84725 RepID=A0A2T0SPE1_9PSEU|nr:hypothetical protein [Umezawaea tangerina]PRY35277.1 hypothetical protein CLV43_114195 [Umezawaea tangerina]